MSSKYRKMTYLTLPLNCSCSDKFNRFDLITVIFGVIETAINPPQFIDGNPGLRSPFAALRAFRTLKLARSWKPLNKLFVAIIDALEEILNFLFFLVLFIYIYALLGMEVS